MPSNEHIIGIIGHRDIYKEDEEYIKRGISTFLANANIIHDKVTVISSLAPGVDLIGAEIALSLGIGLHVVLPETLRLYLNDFDENALKKFEHIISYAKDVVTVCAMPTDTNIYIAPANQIILKSDELIAVWDGVILKDALGGTSDSISKAQEKGIPIQQIFISRSGI
jgi:hypothetical protein